MTVMSKDYYKWVQRFPLLHIRNDKQLAAALEILDELVDKSASKTITAGEDEYLSALGDHVYVYEQKKYGIDERMTPVELISYLMEENSLTQTDIAPLFGGQSRVSDFLSGKRTLSKGQIAKLSERFCINPDALFQAPHGRGLAARQLKVKKTGSSRKHK